VLLWSQLSLVRYFNNKSTNLHRIKSYIQRTRWLVRGGELVLNIVGLGSPNHSFVVVYPFIRTQSCFPSADDFEWREDVLWRKTIVSRMSKRAPVILCIGNTRHTAVATVAYTIAVRRSGTLEISSKWYRSCFVCFMPRVKSSLTFMVTIALAITSHIQSCHFSRFCKF